MTRLVLRLGNSTVEIDGARREDKANVRIEEVADVDLVAVDANIEVKL